MSMKRTCAISSRNFVFCSSAIGQNLTCCANAPLLHSSCAIEETIRRPSGKIRNGTEPRHSHPKSRRFDHFATSITSSCLTAHYDGGSVPTISTEKNKENNSQSPFGCDNFHNY